MGQLDEASSRTSFASRPQAGEGTRSPRNRAWVGLAMLVALAGILGTLLAAHAVANADATHSRQALTASSGEVASTLQLGIQREQDLVISAAAFFLDNPHASNAEFREWSSSVQALKRYPELLGWGDLVIVPASGLKAFAARAAADPVTPLGADGSLHVIPAGTRPYYCLVPTGQARSLKVAVPPGLDFCAGPTGALTFASRDSGRSVYRVLGSGIGNTLAVQVPFYRGGSIPSTAQARRKAFVGWMGMAFSPRIALEAALQHHPGMSVAFRYRDAANNQAFRAGTAPRGAQSVTTDLPSGWTVRTAGAVASGAVLANANAFALLIAGLALSLVLGVLISVLGTGRARAMRLVHERTGELRYQALHDSLTGLPNRALIMDRIDQLLARSRRARTDGAALYVDLDEFKNVNDSLGHEAGDRLLVAVAARLTSTLRAADTIGRMGGDEFVVLIDGGEYEVAPELVAERLLDVMRQPFELDEAPTPIIVNTSIGIAAGDRASAGELLRDADVALYQAKAAGKNRYQTFNAELLDDTSRRLELEFDLRSALEGEQFRLVYQPIYNLDDLALVGVEGLLRWQHPTQGLIQPDKFIPILEQTGQIREVGRWVLHKACEQMAAWHARGDTLDVSVNVSGAQLDSDAIVDHIRGALTISGLDAGSLIIEVTETALMRNAEATARRLRAIKDLGVRIAVDDFGTGYSSLAYLQQFPVDCLKIDRVFTNAITSSPESRALIGTLVQLGKDLGLKTLAEGVETPGQLDHLRGGQVDEIQGFLLSRPLDPQTLEAQILAPTRPRAPSGAQRPPFALA
jgi:diguanylate cyclase (GGDEF)-like protein